MTKNAIAAIDIGGTKIALGLALLDGQTLPFRRFPTQIKNAPEQILDEACRELERMAEEACVRIVSVGIGCGGPLDRLRGLILSPPNLPGWDEFPIVRQVAERFGVPVLLDNDANAAALGEHEYGAGRGLSDLVYITLSTGIGGGIIINEHIVHGVGDGAGEVGHMVVAPDGPPCGCGARGCLEALCSGTSIARRAVELLARDPRPSTLRTGDAKHTITAHMIAVASQAGDELARAVWDETIDYLALGLSNIIAALAPEAIILGGGVSTSGDQLLVPLRERVHALVRIMPVERVQILQASLGGDSGIYGALIIGRRALNARREHDAAVATTEA